GIKFVPISSETWAALENVKATTRSATPLPRRIGAEAARSPAISGVSPQSQRQQFTAPASLPMAESPVPAELLRTPETSVMPAPPSLGPEAKAAAMAELRQRALICVKCPHLARSRKNVVFGVGDINSPLMFVGEAPGADEDVQGEPFVGKA